MPLDIFKGLNKTMAGIVAGRIGKEEFLVQLEQAWFSVVKKDTDIDDEVDAARDRIKKSGFERVFKKVGITDADIRNVLENIKDQKTRPVVNPIPKVGRNEPCPCGSGKKWKRCCGADL